MLLSYNWLRELLPSLTASADEIATQLTAVGLELEELHHVGVGLEMVRLVAVEQVEPHPNRDKLRLVTVTDGASSQTVVCGASNVPEPGGLVVLAPLGAYLPAVDLKLEPRKLGGIVSEGMLCSEEELGLLGSADGILTFAEGVFQPGTPFYQAFPTAQDTIFGIGVTPNRPDALGHRGVARDLAAALELIHELDSAPPTLRTGFNATSLSEKDAAYALAAHVTVRNDATEACPRYGAACVDGVQVQPSPEWLRWRLNALGIRPISNVVDITNLVLLEFGNPMHAFDLDYVAGKTIHIRHAKPGEAMLTLDGVKRELVESDLVIADAEKPSALAGVMGGADSEIRQSTHHVLLEAAYFTPNGVRRTARRLGMHSDSSYRFERGTNWSALESVLARAVGLLEQYAGAKYVGHAFFDGAPINLPTITLRSSRLNRLLGVDVPFDEACGVLTRLGFDKVSGSATQAEFRAAAWRPDVTMETDLVEEVARIRGLDQIPARLPSILPQTPSTSGHLERDTRHIACALGLSEAVCYSFVAPADLAALNAPQPSITLSHPLSEERSVMTTSLLPGLIEAYRRAARRDQHDVRLFTVGSRFLGVRQQVSTGVGQAARPVADTDVGKLPEERLSFAALIAGTQPAYLTKALPVDVFDAKGLVSELVARLTGHDVALSLAPESAHASHLHPRGRALVHCNGQLIGRLGPIHPDVAEKLDLQGAIQLVEIELDTLETLGTVRKKYRPIPRLPAVTRDIAVEAPIGLAAGDILSAIQTSGGQLCESVELFDVFSGGNLAVDRRSLAFRLVYRDPNAATDPDHAKTLTDKQVDKQHQAVVSAVERLGVTIRA